MPPLAPLARRVLVAGAASLNASLASSLAPAVATAQPSVTRARSGAEPAPALAPARAPARALVVAPAAPPPSKALLTPTDLAVGGAFALGALVVAPADARIAGWAQDSSHRSAGLSNAAKLARWAAVPGAVVLPALWAGGRLAGNDRLAALGLHASEAVGIALGTTGVLKGITGRQRPYVAPRDASSWKLGRGWRETDYASFPSGHATIAFAAASAVSGELRAWRPDVRRWLSPVLYAGAAVVGASRIYDDKHWASDVVVGSGIGLLAGRATVRWHQARPGNRLDGWLLSASVLPEAGGGARLSLAILPR